MQKQVCVNKVEMAFKFVNYEIKVMNWSEGKLKWSTFENKDDECMFETKMMNGFEIENKTNRNNNNVAVVNNVTKNILGTLRSTTRPSK